VLHRIVVFAVAVAVTSTAHICAADPPSELDKATAAFDELRYRDAIRLLDGAWRGGGNRPGELRRIFALAGTAAASVGDGAEARIWFSRWLCLERSARLPVGSSPKLVVLFDAARREIGGRALEAHAARQDDGISVTLEDDPLALVVAVRAGDQRQAIAVAGVARLAPTTAPVELVDRYGNVLVELTPAGPAASAPRGEASSEAREDRTAVPGPAIAAGRPWYARWPTWAIAAGGSAVVGGVAFYAASRSDARLDALARESAEHEYSEAYAEERTLARAQWTARIALGVAIASVAVAAVCYVGGREVRTTVTPSSHGASVAWTVRY